MQEPPLTFCQRRRWACSYAVVDRIETSAQTDRDTAACSPHRA